MKMLTYCWWRSNIPVRNPNVDAPTDKPMGTRTVDYSHVENTPVAKTDDDTAYDTGY